MRHGMGLFDRLRRRLGARPADGHAPPAPPPSSRPRPPTPTAADRARERRAAADLLQADAEAKYARERLSLYRARALTGQDTDPGRLRALERDAVAAEERLSHLRGSRAADKAPE